MIFKNQLELKLKEINDIIKNGRYEMNNIGLLGGLSGIAIFHFYYSHFSKEEENILLGANILENCVDKINIGPISPSFCNGISGFGWTIDHLESENFIEIDNDSILTSFDTVLKSQMVDGLLHFNYEFMHGATGIALYFLKRFETTKCNELKHKYRKNIHLFISLLSETAERNGNGITWLSNLNEDASEPCSNLGLSHGITGVIAILTKLVVLKDFHYASKLLLKDSINYLLNTMQKNHDTFSLFPNFMEDETSLYKKSRLGWCYGDLGIGITLLKASKVLNDNNLNKTAIEILIHSANRRTKKETLVHESSFCHGAFGNASMYNFIYNKTGKLLFKETRDFWIKSGINMISPELYYPNKTNVIKNSNWSKELSLIGGVSGIGLVIMNLLSNKHYTWDECFLIS